jgi:hypothetical protein
VEFTFAILIASQAAAGGAQGKARAAAMQAAAESAVAMSDELRRAA